MTFLVDRKRLPSLGQLGLSPLAPLPDTYLQLWRTSYQTRIPSYAYDSNPNRTSGKKLPFQIRSLAPSQSVFFFFNSAPSKLVLTLSVCQEEEWYLNQPAMDNHNPEMMIILLPDLWAKDFPPSLAINYATPPWLPLLSHNILCHRKNEQASGYTPTS